MLGRGYARGTNLSLADQRSDSRRLAARCVRMSAMGAWGVGIFSNDDAADLREELRDLIADGHSANDATNKLVDDYGIGRGGVDDNDFWLGLAAAQHKIGHLGDGVLERAL